MFCPYISCANHTMRHYCVANLLPKECNYGKYAREREAYEAKIEELENKLKIARKESKKLTSLLA